jgi:hypothetical protein
MDRQFILSDAYLSPSSAQSGLTSIPDFKDGPNSATTICGQTMFTNMVRKQMPPPKGSRPLSQQIHRGTPNSASTTNSNNFSFDGPAKASRSCISPMTTFNSNSSSILFKMRPPYEEVQRTESTSSSEKSPKSTDKVLSHALINGNNVSALPVAYVVQFDHSLNEISEEEESIEHVSKSHKMRRTRTSSWGTTLPIVTEETSSDEQSRESPRQSSPTSLQPQLKAACVKTIERQDSYKSQHTTTEQNEILVIMRNLILKQQVALKDMASQNMHYRKKLGEYQIKMINMKQEQIAKVELVEGLQLEKDALEAETMWLREEVKTLRRQGSFEEEDDDSLCKKLKGLMKPHSEPTGTSTFKGSIVDDSPGNTSDAGVICWDLEARDESNAAEDQGDGACQRNDMKENDFKGRVESKPDDGFETTCKTEGITSRSRDADPATKASTPRVGEKVNGETTRETSSTSDALSRIAADLTRSTTKEEVEKFKKRLETIQKKRTERQSMRTSIDKPVVRFSMMTI